LLRGRIYIVGDGEGVVEDGVEEFKRPGVTAYFEFTKVYIEKKCISRTGRLHRMPT
jgi:hypothetical protein